MKKLLIILLSVFSLTAFAQKPKIAVYMTGDDPINEIISNRLVDDFARSNEYTTVERTASFLAELSKEHSYERSGEVDDEQIAALGRQFNVQYVCVTSVLNVWGEEKYITSRIIDTETAEVVASCSSNGSIQNSSELIGALNILSDNFFKAMRSTKQDDAKKVAVYVTKTGNSDVDVVLGDQLVAGFAKSGRYLAIERTSGFLKKLKEEQGYQQSGAVADDDLTRWGQQFGVQYICIAKTTSWAGDYFITTRMVDAKTGEVVNSYKVEGRKMSNSLDVVRTAREIAAELSKGTLAEQAEEARLKREAEEARIRVEEEARLRAEANERARIELEEKKLQQRLEAKRKELNDNLSKGYFIVDKYGKKYMICIRPLTHIKGSEAKVHKQFTACGYDDWVIYDRYKNWVMVREEISKFASECLHYLNITLPICTKGQSLWVINDDGIFFIARNTRLSEKGNCQYIDGLDTQYEFNYTQYSYDSGLAVRGEYANAILIREVK